MKGNNASAMLPSSIRQLFWTVVFLCISALLLRACKKHSRLFQCRAQRKVDRHGYNRGSDGVDGSGGYIPCQSQFRRRLSQNRQLVEISYKGVEYYVE